MTTHDVYVLRDADEHVLYVGCTADLFARLEQHRARQSWYPEVDSVAVESFSEDRAEALADELRLIREYDPPHNMVGTPRLRPYLQARAARSRRNWTREQFAEVRAAMWGTS